MTCRQCQGIEQVFDAKEAQGDLKSYRKKGPSKTTAMLVEALTLEGIEGLTVLDIGGGVGAVQYGLLDAGASEAVGVDASTAYIEAAHEEAGRRGLSDRVSYRHGDFVDVAADIDAAGIVTLDKVICCYHDMKELVGQSAEKATKLYGLVYPRDNWGARIVFRLFNLFLWLRRNPFRTFIHRSDAAIGLAGFRRLSYRRTFIWQVAVYGRPQGG